MIMKKFTKWIALLMAGLLLLATLLACDDGYDWAAEDDDDDDEESESYDKYKNLNPDEVWDALLEAKDYTISVRIHRTYEGNVVERTMTVEKDGNKVKLYASANSPDGSSYEELSYCDLDKHLLYEQSGDQWDVDQHDDVTLDVLLKEELEAEILFTEGLYGEYDKETRTYPMIPEKLIEVINGNNDMTASGSMTRKGTAYTFLIQLENESQKQTVEFVLTFESVKVDLPKVETPEGDENQPENNPTPENPIVTQKPVDTQKPDAPQPPVTEKPDAPQPPVTEKPDSPIEPAFDSPAEAYQNARYASSMSLRYMLEADSQKQILTIRKYENVLYVTIEAGDRFMESYMDLQTGYLYTQDIDGDWCYEFSDSVVEWEMIVGDLFTYGMQIFTEDEFTVFEDDRFIATEDAMERLSQVFKIEILGASMQYDEYDNIYSYEYSEYNSIKGVFTDIRVDMCFDTYYLNLPDAYEKGKDDTENDGEGTEDGEKPDYDYSAYENLTPDELYDAMLTTTELYFFFEVNGDQVVFTRSGDWVELNIYTYQTGKIQIYYQDLSSNTLYKRISNSYYEKVDYYYTWTDLIDMAIAQAKTTYYLQNDCYAPFTEESAVLELDPNRTPCSVRNAILTRSSYYYHFEGTLDGEFIYFTIDFSDQTVDLPNL
jgi:hypothetical protein